jgi:hypothetical protein
MHIVFEDGTKTEFEGFDIDTQVELLGLIAKNLSCDECTQVKFTATLNAFTKLRFKDKEQEIHVWIKSMKNILENGKLK